jgi:hypothetical protein
MNFEMIGVSVYIASRHMKAIKETDNHLIAALDSYDEMRIMEFHIRLALSNEAHAICETAIVLKPCNIELF